MGVAGVMARLGPVWEAARGVRLEATFEPTLRILPRIRNGELGDVAILTDQAIDELVGSGVLIGRTDLARSFVGVAVRTGAAHPDISTRKALIRTLLDSPSVAMSEAGASGVFMAALLQQLGIAEQVRAKATILRSGYTAELVRSGAVQLAIQQVSELMVVPGVEIVGRLPAELGGVSVFSAGAFAEAADPVGAAALIAELAAPAHAALYRECGLEQAGTPAPLQA